MNRLKNYSILGAIFVIFTGTISHFIYEWSGKNFILGFFFPVNESTWEHMKLCFFPMLVYSMFMKKKLENAYPCVASALLFGTLFGTFLIPIIFYTYTGILGKNFLPLDIATFILSVLLAFLAVYRFTLSCRVVAYTDLLRLSVLVTTVFFFIFSYFPPKLGIFIAPA